MLPHFSGRGQPRFCLELTSLCPKPHKAQQKWSSLNLLSLFDALYFMCFAVLSQRPEQPYLLSAASCVLYRYAVRCSRVDYPVWNAMQPWLVCLQHIHHCLRVLSSTSIPYAVTLKKQKTWEDNHRTAGARSYCEPIAKGTERKVANNFAKC